MAPDLREALVEALEHGRYMDLVPMLEVIERGIGDTLRRRADWGARSGNELFAKVMQSECDEEVENYLGLTFVVLQLVLTSSCATANRCRRAFGRKELSKQRLLELGNGSASRHPKGVVLIHSAANYFKHRDEWKSWGDTESSQQMATLASLRAVGCDEGAADNLAKVAGALGVHDLSKLVELDVRVTEWSIELIEFASKAD